MYKRPRRPAMGFMFSQHALAPMNHRSLSGLTHPSPTGSWEAFGSPNLSDESWFTVTVNSNCTASSRCTCSALKSRWLDDVYFMHSCLQTLNIYSVPNIQPKHTVCMRYCIPQCIMHSVRNELQVISLFLTSLILFYCVAKITSMWEK